MSCHNLSHPIPLHWRWHPRFQGKNDILEEYVSLLITRIPTVHFLFAKSSMNDFISYRHPLQTPSCQHQVSDGQTNTYCSKQSEFVVCVLPIYLANLQCRMHECIDIEWIWHWTTYKRSWSGLNPNTNTDFSQNVDPLVNMIGNCVNDCLVRSWKLKFESYLLRSGNRSKNGGLCDCIFNVRLAVSAPNFITCLPKLLWISKEICFKKLQKIYLINYSGSVF